MAFKVRFFKRYTKMLGENLAHREKNRARHKITIEAMSTIGLLEERGKRYIAHMLSTLYLRE